MSNNNPYFIYKRTVRDKTYYTLAKDITNKSTHVTSIVSYEDIDPRPIFEERLREMLSAIDKDIIDLDGEVKDTHRAEVFKIEEILKHPNADSLGIVKYKDFQLIVNLKDWTVGQYAVHIQPDTLVPLEKPCFAWLKSLASSDDLYYRIRTVKLRGEYSEGLLVPTDCTEVGKDLSKELGLKRYNLVSGNVFTPSVSVPGLFIPTYDLSSIQGNVKYFSSEYYSGDVVVTEKIHGASARATFHEGKLRIGSRKNWKEKYHVTSEVSPWWSALEPYAEFCEKNPDLVLYGEMYGKVQKLTYGVKDHRFVAFDIWNKKEKRWLDFAQFYDTVLAYGIPCVPLLYVGQFDLDKFRSLAESDSTLSLVRQMSEGVVISTVTEQYYGKNRQRMKAKLVSNRYLSKGE